MPSGVYTRTEANLRNMAEARRITPGVNQRDHWLMSTWNAMRMRCNNPEDKDYPRYGARGITVCDEWDKFLDFANWIEANLGERPEGYTLDRIDNSLGYRPRNVRWATKAHQQQNTRGRGGSSQYKGVSWVQKASKWYASIKVDGKSINLGYYDDEAKAARSYDAAAIKYFGDFAAVNFPLS